jgi:anthranilate synthase
MRATGRESTGGTSVTEWLTKGGVRVVRRTVRTAGEQARNELVDALGDRRGLLLSSAYEQPGRYVRHDLGYVNPPIELALRGVELDLRALNERGQVLLPALARALAGVLDVDVSGPDRVRGTVPTAEGILAEEDRTRRPGAFSALRALMDDFAGSPDPLFGLYGAFGYDLVFALDPMPLHQHRVPADRELVLHLPDRVLAIDPMRAETVEHTYEFEVDGRSTEGLPRHTPPVPFAGPGRPAEERDHQPGEYAQLVTLARQRFTDGELFEVVPGQSFHRTITETPSNIFRKLRRRNPAPYGLLANLGAGEYLVGASPEMFVRVGAARPEHGGRRLVESCPISGTIARGRDALEDAKRIRELLNSEKEESELTMCTDVDRNDKARVCEPDSIRVVARRQLELYATLIHTVDHIEGVLRPERDCLDAFLTHMWAVTVTGAPKRAAIAFIEEHERSARRWYGGAVGRIGFDGSLDTALTLRTIQIRDGVATVRVGATLLHDSDPAAEERETVLKAKALLEALEPAATLEPDGVTPDALVGEGLSVLLVDHQDSFVHTLAAYFRRTGAEVSTYRSGFPPELLDTLQPDLLVLSPGPGRPVDFGVDLTISQAEERGIPVFGVCLGLQGVVEYYGGDLRLLDRPVHGKPSLVCLVDGGGQVFAGLPEIFEAGRYHSICAEESTLPDELMVTARAADGVVMGIAHRTRPIAAVQFHPESIMTQSEGQGEALIANVVASLARRPEPAARH